MSTLYSVPSTDKGKHADIEQVEDRNASARVVVTPEDDVRIRKLTDRRILPVLIIIYLLQILDKALLGYASIFGLQTDAHLVGTQYSQLGSIAPIAQLCWLPFSSYLIVRFGARPLMTVLVLGWGCAAIGMAFSLNFKALMATRFFLGLFEAACLPLFAMITAQWYRRSEQTVRIAMWYGTNGIATIIGSIGSYGLGHINSPHLHSWQIIFLVGGLLTVCSAPVIWWRLDNDIQSARFLSEEDKLKAVERLRSNNTGVGSYEFKWPQVIEAFMEPKTWLWIGMSLAVNVGASVTNVFGPLILSGLGYDKYLTSLLNSPFGAVQLLVIIAGSYAAYKFKLKGVVLSIFMIPVLIGLILLYVLPRTGSTGPLLVAYYLLGFLYCANPLIVSWIVGNTAGQTKKSITMMNYNIGSSAGNIIGPLLFNAADKPKYLPGIRATLGIFIALEVIIGLQVLNLMWLNKRKEKQRVANGKPAKLVDMSMSEQYRSAGADVEAGDRSEVEAKQVLDQTDGKNDEFVFVY